LRRPLVVAALAVTAFLTATTAAATDGRFVATPPLLGDTSYRASTVRYQADLAYRSYRSGTTDIAGPSVSLQRRQAFSDRFAFTLGGTAGYLSGSDRIIDSDDELSVWQAIFQGTGELQHYFTPRWNAIFFAGPQFGIGGYEVEQEEPPHERLDADTQLFGYVFGIQSTLRTGSLNITPFVAYEETEARHEMDSSVSGRSTEDYQFDVLQYGVRAELVGSGLVLGATIQRRSVGSQRSRYTIYNLGYRF